MDAFTEAFRAMQAHAERSPACLVSFSGGKESLVVLDMAVKAFQRVVCFHYYFVPGLRVVEEQMEAARRRWGVEILHYPGPLLVETLKAGQFCEDSYKAAGLPDWSREDIMRLARGETGIRLVVSGAKFSDGLGQGLKHRQLARRRAEEGREGDELLPLAKWNKWDVLAYLKANKIPLPESDGRNSSSIDCSTACLLWLHDRHPDDFELVCKVFRYAKAVVYRRRWHGVK